MSLLMENSCTPETQAKKVLKHDLYSSTKSKNCYFLYLKFNFDTETDTDGGMEYHRVNSDGYTPGGRSISGIDLK